MRKWILWGILLAALAGGIYFLQTSVEEQIAEEVRSAVGNNANTEVDLSLKGIELKQGEDGKELWVLKASNGWYQKDKAVIDLSKPEITYFTQPKRDKILIVAPHGTINQGIGEARLRGNVTVTSSRGLLTSSELIFFDKTKELSLIGPVHFSGQDFSGSSDHAQWDLESNDITATGNVIVNFKTNSLQEQ
ncbi:MAG: LPS export ABC transporter periplasmic protein LptC [Desulfovibrionales bacterium]|nr:LPS export ABC transporter periplasmic protein LptC [Desulfovibrionales bacterium]